MGHSISAAIVYVNPSEVTSDRGDKPWLDGRDQGPAAWAGAGFVLSLSTVSLSFAGNRAWFFFRSNLIEIIVLQLLRVGLKVIT